jgi:RNA polymerase sigma factor (sigma-70 family)
MSTQPPTRDQAAVTQLLVRAGKGEAQATNELFPIVYDELRSIASSFLRGESNAQTLQATALVHETYMRLVGPNETPWENRAHFFAAAARAIRRILVDHARSKARVKRGGVGVGNDEEGAIKDASKASRTHVSLEDVAAVGPQESSLDFVQLDEAMEKLFQLDAQKAKVVELRFFGGLTVEQTALALGVSPSTVARDWQFARVWLAKELAESDGSL